MKSSQNHITTKASIVVCTFNRAQHLLKLLNSLLAMDRMPGMEWEIIIVDNNSRDDTPSQCESFMKKNPEITVFYIVETRQGIACARNRGIKEASGNIIIFIDDDEIVEKGWMRAMVTPFLEEKADCVGGKIHLCYTEELPRPRWLTDELEGFIGKLDHGDKPFQVSDRSTPLWSGNLAVSKDVFARIGYFNEELKRGSDADMFLRVLENGFRMYYEPASKIWHILDSKRLNKGWFRFLHHTAGKQQAMHLDAIEGRMWFHIPRYLFPQLLRSILQYVIAFISNGPSGSLRKEMNVWWLLGYMKGCRLRSDEILGRNDQTPIA